VTIKLEEVIAEHLVNATDPTEIDFFFAPDW